MKKMLSILGITVLIFVLTASSAHAREISIWRMGTGGMTGTSFLTGSAVALMINEKLDGVRAAAQATNGSVDNVFLIGDGEIDMGWINSTTVRQAVEGVGSFDEPKPFLRGIGWVMNQTLHIVVNNNSGIETVEDLRGRRHSVGAMGSGTEVNVVAVLDLFGIGEDEFTRLHSSTAEAWDQVVSGHSEAFISFTTIGGASVTDALAQGSTRLLQLTSEQVQRLVDEHPQFAFQEIPGGTYRDFPYTIYTIASPMLLVVHEDISEECVYIFTKAFFENYDFLVGQSMLLEPARPENSLLGMPVELHPGAARFLREIGVLQ